MIDKCDEVANARSGYRQSEDVGIDVLASINRTIVYFLFFAGLMFFVAEFVFSIFNSNSNSNVSREMMCGVHLSLFPSASIIVIDPDINDSETASFGCGLFVFLHLILSMGLDMIILYHLQWLHGLKRDSCTILITSGDRDMQFLTQESIQRHFSSSIDDESIKIIEITIIKNDGKKHRLQRLLSLLEQDIIYYSVASSANLQAVARFSSYNDDDFGSDAEGTGEENEDDDDIETANLISNKKSRSSNSKKSERPWLEKCGICKTCRSLASSVAMKKKMKRNNELKRAEMMLKSFNNESLFKPVGAIIVKFNKQVISKHRRANPSEHKTIELAKSIDPTDHLWTSSSSALAIQKIKYNNGYITCFVRDAPNDICFEAFQGETSPYVFESSNQIMVIANVLIGTIAGSFVSIFLHYVISHHIVYLPSLFFTVLFTVINAHVLLYWLTYGGLMKWSHEYATFSKAESTHLARSMVLLFSLLFPVYISLLVSYFDVKSSITELCLGFLILFAIFCTIKDSMINGVKETLFALKPTLSLKPQDLNIEQKQMSLGAKGAELLTLTTIGLVSAVICAPSRMLILTAIIQYFIGQILHKKVSFNQSLDQSIAIMFVNLIVVTALLHSSMVYYTAAQQLSYTNITATSNTSTVEHSSMWLIASGINTAFHIVVSLKLLL